MNKKEIKRILSGFDRVDMPNKDKILSSCPNAEEKASVRKGTGKRNALILAVAVAALLALVGCAAEVKEYNDAVTFFEEYSLSTDNLSRSEIKKVYRDIITEQFALEQTAVVILDQVKGYVVGVSVPSSEELKKVWDDLTVSNDGPYSWYYLDNEIEEEGIIRSGEMMFCKIVDCEVIWETKIPLRDGYVEDYVLLKNGKYVAVYGVYSPSARGSKNCGFIELFDAESGESLWRKIFDDYRHFSVSAVLPSEEGLVAFCRGDLENFVFVKLDLSGDIIHKNVTEIGNKGIWNVANFEDGYIMQLGSYQQNEKLVKVSDEGEISDGFSYSSEDTAYFITDMMEYGGKLYLSAYAVPKNGREIVSGHGEIVSVLDEIIDMYMIEIGEHPDAGFGLYAENLTEKLRENYTAVLLVCDSESGRPSEFYSIEGSVCGELSINEDGEMLWETEYISDSYYSPATSSFSIGGACHVYRHTFDKKGDLISSEKTGEVTDFRR